MQPRFPVPLRPLIRATALQALLFLWCTPGCGRPDRASPVDASHLDEAWNAVNDPATLRDRFETRLAALPVAGELAKVPWTDSYWPNYQGGLAQRWHADDRPDAFTYPLHDRQALAALPEDLVAQLSPAEKYDIYVGNYGYPLVNYERRRNSADDPSWYGLCHGWAPAALVFDEPKPVTLTSRDGVRIPFGASDVKALLTFVQQYDRPWPDSRMMGDRCNHDLATDPDHADDPECRDVNAGSFHIIVANQLGIDRVGVVAELNRGYQVWNHPVHGFATQIVSQSDEVYDRAAPGTVKIATVRTTLRYVVELGAAWEPMPPATFPWQVSEQVYIYKLELDAAGRILGGEWDGTTRPDFVWTQTAPRFGGYFGALRDIYEASIQ